MPGSTVSSTRLFLVLFLTGVAAFSPAFAQQQNATPASPPAVSPGFTVKLTYSQKAMDTLVARKETVIVAGYLTVFAKQGTPKRLIAEGQVSLGQVKKEIAPGQTAVFGPVQLDQAALKWADNRGPQLLINVYSGRKSSPNNLLDCGIYEGPLQSVQGQIINISCKLIGE